MTDHQIAAQEGFSSSDESDSANSHGSLIFEYLEKDPPYSREPLADKVCFPILFFLRYYLLIFRRNKRNITLIYMLLLEWFL